MYFSTDQQTLNDLKIFGRTGSESVFTLFDRTQTRGGAARLEEMFRYPMADPERINARSTLLQHLSNSKQEFHFSREIFDVIELYLENTDERSKLPVKEVSVSEKLKGMIAIDPHVKTVQSGVMAIRILLAEMNEFLELLLETFEFDEQDLIGLEEIKKFCTETDLNEFYDVKINKPLSYVDLAKFDVLLRFRKRDSIKACLQRIYLLDAYISVARVGYERNFCYPIAMPATEQTIIFEEVFHPYVKGAIPNSLRIDPQGNIIFLTGANMAGKSTLMKSLGIALFLGHMGFPVPAKRMRFSVREGIYTSINLPDNLNKGISHFYAEVLRIKKVSLELGKDKNLFVITDELFRGTNVKDAYEATVAITAAFAAKQNCMFVVSTHIMEAGDTLRQQCKNIKFVYLPTKMNGNEPVYTYRLEEGITADRHGMIIVRNAGILKLLNRDLINRSE